MTTRLVMTNQGLEVTPGNIETMDVYFQSNKAWIASTGVFEFVIGFTLHAWNSTNVFPFFVQAASLTGLVIDNAGRLFYRVGTDETRSITDPRLIIELGVYKQIRVFRDGFYATVPWKVEVDGVLIGSISNTLNLNPENLNSIGGNTVRKPPVFTINDIILNSPDYVFYYLFQGDGRSLLYDDVLKVMPNAVKENYDCKITAMGTVASKNVFVFVEAPFAQGSYYIESVAVPSTTKGIYFTMDPIEINWKTQSFVFEVFFNVTAFADITFLGDENCSKCRWGIVGSVFQYTEYLTNITLNFPRAAYPDTTSDNPFVRRIYSWNHLTNQMTLTWQTTVESYTLDTTTFPGWNGIYPRSFFTHIGPNNTLLGATILGGLGPVSLVKLRLSVDGVEKLHLNTELISPPPIEERLKDPLGYYYNEIVTPGKKILKVYNAQKYWKWTARQNSIEYIGPSTLPNVITVPTTPGELTVAEILTWFDLRDDDVTCELMTNAEYTYDGANQKFLFPWSGLQTTDVVARAYVKHNLGDIEGLAVSPPFLIMYSHNPIAFEPDCFEVDIFDTTDNLPPYTTEDGFESVAFDNDVFEMNPSGPPAEKLRMLKYYTGSAWTGVPIKMWAGSAWTEVQLKVCTSGSTFTKISG